MIFVNKMKTPLLFVRQQPSNTRGIWEVLYLDEDELQHYIVHNANGSMRQIWVSIVIVFDTSCCILESSFRDVNLHFGILEYIEVSDSIIEIQKINASCLQDTATRQLLSTPRKLLPAPIQSVFFTFRIGQSRKLFLKCMKQLPFIYPCTRCKKFLFFWWTKKSFIYLVHLRQPLPIY